MYVSAAACTPADDYDTRLYAVAALRSRFPGGLVKTVLKPFGLRIFHQDSEILALQTATTHRFGEEVYASTDVDLLGPHIMKLLLRAEKGELGDPKEQPWTRRIEMDA